MTTKQAARLSLRSKYSTEDSSVRSHHRVHASSISPSTHQQSALIALKDFDSDVILAWITLLQSVGLDSSNLRSRSITECISKHQFDALNILRNYDINTISTWLGQDRYASAASRKRTPAPSRNNSLSSSRRSSIRNGLRDSTWSAAESSVGSFTSFSTGPNASTYSTPRSSVGYENLLSEVPGSVTGTKQSHKRWCTYGKHSNVFITSDGWKRHMKEHDRLYFCMPRGPMELIEGIHKCAFCGIPNPSATHLKDHRAFECVGPFNMPLSKTRKSNIKKHLLSHGVIEQAVSELADSWRLELDRKAFSCGFCVVLFDTHGQQLNHIDMEHFAKGQGMNEWSQTNVIKGLLLHPPVNIAWQVVLESNPSIDALKLHWDTPNAETLQLWLEMGSLRGDELAIAALKASSHTMTGNCDHRATTAVPAMRNITGVGYSHLNDLPTTSDQSMTTSPWLQEYDVGVVGHNAKSWNKSSKPPAWGGFEHCEGTLAVRTSHDSSERQWPDGPPNWDVGWDRLSADSVSTFECGGAMTHIGTSLDHAFENSFPHATWPDLVDHSDPTYLEGGVHSSQKVQFFHPIGQHPETHSESDVNHDLFPLRVDSLRDTPVSSSPAASEAPRLLRGQAHLYGWQDKPLPAVPEHGEEIESGSFMDYKFDNM